MFPRGRLTALALKGLLTGALLVPAVRWSLDLAAQGPVTFNRDVAPIVFDHCVSCHRPGEAAPFPLLTYQDAKQRARLIAAVTENHYMPPWQPDSEAGEFEGDRRLEQAQIDVVRQWAEGGALEGEAADLPSVPSFSSGWRLGTPDLVVAMPEAFEVPAAGADVFRNFVLPVPLGERQYVRAIEFRPGNARVLHHARILLDETGEIRRLDQADAGPGFPGMEVPGARFPDGHFLGWAPGKMPKTEAFPWPIEPGTDLVVQMHLKPTGRAESVRSSIALYLTNQPPTVTPLMVRLGSKTIDIPAGAPRYEVTDSYLLPIDVTVTSVYPHAHYLAKEMTVSARKADGQVETLLHIPNWNFNWQDEYEYRRPLLLKRGTTIVMRYTYDNSAANPHNPSQPPRRVRFGAETTDEMGEVLLQVLPRRAADIGTLRSDVMRKTLMTDIAGEEKRIRDEPSDHQTRNALGVAYTQVGRVPEALKQFQEVLRLVPTYPSAHYNLAVIAMGERRLDEAATHLMQALAARPDYAEAHNNLGVVFEAGGRLNEAMAQYRAAIEARPTLAAAHGNLGRGLLTRGQPSEAVTHFRIALRTKPDNADALYNLGRAHLAQGQPRDAAQQWRRAMAARPDSVPILVDLAWLLASHPEVENAGEAVGLAERANNISKGRDPAVLDLLSVAYAADGRLELAVRVGQRALQRAIAAKQEGLAAEIRQRLEGYQKPAGDAEIP